MDGLGNFLSGMETGAQKGRRVRGEALGNFLSGMETTFLSPPMVSSGTALETSLVEWKPSDAVKIAGLPGSLETSLVEWKLLVHHTGVAENAPLETSLVEWKPLFDPL